ncbi:pyridoxamine 5'-phosphate oxidase family protein [Streptomyces rectiviolaceus]|uniref:Pyridoxamine 5'-phosphate oxidase N-terminal domain-containing protein n=1 Tax=Streptomyces rectiviolaceus TaxID=332591 RepID=A0ABP6NJ29_9ACTN
MSTETTGPRAPEQRKLDALHRLTHDVDVWVATADADGGTPYLIPLSFLWDGESLLVATPDASVTGRNLRATGKARVGVGPTRDVILIEGDVRALGEGELTAEAGDAFAEKTGFDPRKLDTVYTYFRITPQRLQAWREADELKGRELMAGGRWTVR